MATAAVRHDPTVVVDVAGSDLEIVRLALAVLAAESAVVRQDTRAVAVLAGHGRFPPERSTDGEYPIRLQANQTEIPLTFTWRSNHRR